MSMVFDVGFIKGAGQKVGNCLKFYAPQAQNAVLRETMRLGKLNPGFVAEIEFSANALATELAGDPHRNAGQIFEALRNEERFFGQAAELIRNPGNSDLYDNPVFQALVWLMRVLPKIDCHSHLSRNMHETEIAETVMEAAQNETVYQKMLASLPAGCSFLPDMHRLVPAREVDALATLYAENKLLSSKSTDDFYVVSPEIIRSSAKFTCLRSLSDGVLQFNIRLNPVKDILFFEKGRPHSEREWREIISGTIAAAQRGIEDAIRQTSRERAIMGPDFPPKIGIMLSISRNKAPYLLSSRHDGLSSREMALFALEVSREFGDLVRGIDVSDNEYVSSDYGQFCVRGWGPFFERARELGLITTAHVGDFRYADDSPAIADVLESLEQAYDAGQFDIFNSGVVSMVRDFLPFVEEFLKIMPEGSGIGHGYIFDPGHLVNPFWDTGKIKWLDVLAMDQSGFLKAEDARLKDIIRRKRFYIETCPAATLRGYKDIGSFGELSLHRWLKEGLPVRLGTDAGVFSFNRPRVLSDIMARLFISNPDRNEGLIPLTFAQVLNMAGLE